MHDTINTKKIFYELKLHKLGILKLIYLIIHYLFKYLHHYILKIILLNI